MKKYLKSDLKILSVMVLCIALYFCQMMEIGSV